MNLFNIYTSYYLGRRCFRYALRGYGIAWLELLFCTVIIAVLTAIGAGIYQEQVRVARVARAVVGVPMADIRTDMMVYHAHTGLWPDSMDALRRRPDLARDGYQTDPAIDTLTVEDGAMHLVLAGSMQGGTVTVRPGVPADDPLGPVAWYAGPPLNGKDLSLAGKDRTTIPRILIHPRLR